MALKYCEYCGKNTNTARQIGIGSLIAVLVTAGFWILVLPFYSKKCVVCNGSQLKSAQGNKQMDSGVPENPLIGIEKLERLAALRDKGIITEEEFQKEKKKIL